MSAQHEPAPPAVLFLDLRKIQEGWCPRCDRPLDTGLCPLCGCTWTASGDATAMTWTELWPEMDYGPNAAVGAARALA